MNKSSLQQDNFVYMLIGLMLFLLAAPSLSKSFSNHSGVVIQSIYLSFMFASVWSLQKNQRWFFLGLGLIIVSIALTLFSSLLDAQNTRLLNLLPLLIFCILSAVVAMRQVLFSGPVTLNKLAGSVCIYFLLGIIWALFYLYTDQLTDNTFTGLTAEEPGKLWSYIYFSFITLSTLGFGDITPVNEFARALVYIEAISGQFYLTILVASLIGGYVNEHPLDRH
ncbi:MAG: potassium channel family protein [Cycloclasticus sp.]